MSAQKHKKHKKKTQNPIKKQVKKITRPSSKPIKKANKPAFKKALKKPINKKQKPIKKNTLSTKKNTLKNTFKLKKPVKKAAKAVKTSKPLKKTKQKSSKQVASLPVQASKKVAIPKKQSFSKKSKNTQSVPSKKTDSQSLPIVSEDTKALVLSARKRTSTPSIFKLRRKNTPVIFTLEDVYNIIQNQGAQSTKVTHPTLVKGANKSPIGVKSDSQKTSKIPTVLPPAKARVLGAASLIDVLGFNPKNAKVVTASDEEAAKIPEKFRRYYKLLVDLRSHIQSEMDLHAKDALKRSNKEDAGDLSAYSQHMADAGTDTFDRDFALSILSNEQDALFEIDEAIQKMIQGTYGVCEVTGAPISRERLLAVPFTRCSLEGQQQLEKNKRRMSQRSSGVGVFAEIFDDEGSFLDEEESSET